MRMDDIKLVDRTCGHLRVYHSVGCWPTAEFKERKEFCPFCRIAELEAQLARSNAANVYDGNAHRRVSELEAALHDIRDRGHPTQWVYSIIRDVLHSAPETFSESGGK
jgi:hypothetical protein